MHRIEPVVTKRRLGDPDDSWTGYWLTRPVQERLAMATELSLECHGVDASARLQRVHRIVRRP